MGQCHSGVGGDYSDCRFDEIERGDKIVHGPDIDELKARTEWKRLTFRDYRGAVTRCSICVEPVRR